MLGRYGEISEADTVDGNGNKDTLGAQLCAQKHACIHKATWMDRLHTHTPLTWTHRIHSLTGATVHL